MDVPGMFPRAGRDTRARGLRRKACLSDLRRVLASGVLQGTVAPGPAISVSVRLSLSKWTGSNELRCWDAEGEPLESVRERKSKETWPSSAMARR